MTLRRTLFIAGACGLLACSGPRTATTSPVPADEARLLAWMAADAVLWQHTSAEAYRLFQQGYELARMRLDANLQQLYGLPPAVIVDVDETVLDNSPYEVRSIARGSTYSDSTWSLWTAEASARALPGALEFLTYVASRDCEVFYVTNRGTADKPATVRNLRELGFPYADDAHVLTREETSDKSPRRIRIGLDYDIRLLVGDQLRDFDELFKDRTVDFGRPLVDQHLDTLSKYFVLMPNPMYGTWRDAITGKGTDAQKAEAVRAFFREHDRP